MSQTSSEGTLTVLFTDLEGSTDLRTRVGDETANQVIREHESLIQAEVKEFGGFGAKALGDGFMILFSSARQAIKAAVSIQRAIDARNRENPDLPIQVRIGINSGDVTQEDDDVYGTAVHAAARVASKAQGDQILVAQIVHDLAGMVPDVRLTDRGLFWLKGFPDRWRLYEVLWREKGDDRPPSTRSASSVAGDLDLDMPRTTGPMVGRSAELAITRQELTESSKGGLRAVVLEGEAGIGKTRVLEAVDGLVRESDTPCQVLSVAADEELRGPFLLFRTLLGTPTIASLAREAMALESLERARDAVGGRGASRQEGLSPQEQMLRVADEVTSAIADLARDRQLALLFDDLQWADDDSIRLIRYLVRTVAALPIFVLIALRPYSDAAVGSTANLVSDLERMHLGRRLRLQRFTRHETVELLTSLLDAPVAEATVDSLHSRAEGVPFFIEEFGRAYREANVLQLIDGTWTMTQLTGPAVPASVQSLIARRVAQLSEDCRDLLADAAVLGRRFRLSDLADVMETVGSDTDVAELEIEDSFRQAVSLGIVTRMPESATYDYSFTHDEIRAALVASRPRQRKQKIHGAIVDMLAQDESLESIALLAYHALHAGDEERAVSYALKAANASLRARAPEETIHIIDAALTATSRAEDRVELLRIKDDALELLDRGEDRMANLAELSALTGAVQNPDLSMEVKLRRSAAARMSRDFETAVDLAGSVREEAIAKDARRMELEACLELGQAITRSPLGEGFWPLVEIDIEAADEPFQKALELARELGERSLEAAALRERSVLEAGRVKNMAMSFVAQGASRLDIQQQAPPFFEKAKSLAAEALTIYEDLGDRRGAMTALISMAYGHVTDPTPRGMAGRMEHVRKLHNKRKHLTSETQQAIDDAYMLYSIHVYALANANADLALARGRETFEAARALGDRWLEFLAAGGIGQAYLSLGSVEQAEGWVDRAASAALAAPGAALARRVEMWRGLLAAAKGDGEAMLSRLERAAELALENSSPAGRCEAIAMLAMEAAKLGAMSGDETMLEKAESAAIEAQAQAASLPGRLPWQAQAWAAMALSRHLMGSTDEAADNARTALSLLQPRFNPAQYLGVLWMAGRTLIEQGAPEAEDLAKEIFEDLSYIDETTVDPEIKADWFAVPMHRELAEMAGYQVSESAASPSVPETLEPRDFEILRLLTSGDSDEQIADQIGADDETVKRQISELLETLGVSNRTEATEFAVKAGIT